MATLFKKIKGLFEQLTLRPRIGGLQISDAAFYYALSDGTALSLKLPPGVVAEGKIADLAQFREFLGQFREMLDSKDRTRSIPVIVALPAAMVYTQGFSVPNVGPERLAESATLNLEMLSPIPRGAAYLSWQVTSEAEDHVELLGAFAEKKYVDEIQEALVGARFRPIAFEFPGLALTRLAARSVRAAEGSTLVFYLSSDGVNLFLCRGSSLWFDYFRSWRSIQGENREVSRELFDTVVSQEMQKVVNFTVNRFKEAPEQVVIIAPEFEAELRDLIRDRFGFEALSLDLRDPAVEAPWYVAFGCALRGEEDPSQDTGVSLAPVSSAELFYEEQLLDFIRFWRSIAGGVLALFLLMFIGAASLLSNQSKSLDRQLELFSNAGQSEKLATLEEQARRFNALVATVGSVGSGGRRYSALAEALAAAAADNRVTVDSYSLGSPTDPIELAAEAPDYDTVLRFSEALKAVPGTSNVNLPLSRISTREDGSVAFVVTLRFTPTPTP